MSHLWEWMGWTNSTNTRLLANDYGETKIGAKHEALILRISLLFGTWLWFVDGSDIFTLQRKAIRACSGECVAARSLCVGVIWQTFVAFFLSFCFFCFFLNQQRLRQARRRRHFWRREWTCQSTESNGYETAKCHMVIYGKILWRVANYTPAYC